jgi:hypothetical protein
MPNKWCGWLLVALTVGCGERSRLTFEDGGGPNDETPPVALIDVPGQDTTVVEGDPLLIGTQVTDDHGVDTVYVELEGADHELQPFQGEGRDTVLLAFPITTLGNHGLTITVQVFGVDLAGNRGQRAIRKITVE